MKALRAWQGRALAYLLEGAGRRCLQAPTGAGKSRVLREFSYCRIRMGQKVLIVVPSVEIARQFRGDILRESTLRPGWDLDGAKCYHPAHQLVITTHASFWRSAHLYPASRWDVVYDECHHGNELAPTHLAALDRFPSLIGASASPWTPECVQIFGDRVFVYGLAQAIADQVVSPYEVALGQPEGEPTAGRITFLGSIREVDAAGGVHCHLDPEERSRRIGRFKAGSVREIAAMGMLREGFDADVGEVVIRAHTSSAVALYQMAGRALRARPGKVAKIWISKVSHRKLLGALRRAG